MHKRRSEQLVYYFLVEGDVEKWYLQWLQNKINEEAKQKGLGKKVRIYAKIGKDPVSYMKSRPLKRWGKKPEDHKTTQFVDYESKDEKHQRNFQAVIDGIDKVKQEWKVAYQLGYSNFTLFSEYREAGQKATR